jgi:hypothetical protein
MAALVWFAVYARPAPVLHLADADDNTLGLNSANTSTGFIAHPVTAATFKGSRSGRSMTRIPDGARRLTTRAVTPGNILTKPSFT